MSATGLATTALGTMRSSGLLSTASFPGSGSLEEAQARLADAQQSYADAALTGLTIGTALSLILVYVARSK